MPLRPVYSDTSAALRAENADTSSASGSTGPEGAGTTPATVRATVSARLQSITA